MVGETAFKIIAAFAALVGPKKQVVEHYRIEKRVGYMAAAKPDQKIEEAMLPRGANAATAPGFRAFVLVFSCHFHTQLRGL